MSAVLLLLFIVFLLKQMMMLSQWHLTESYGQFRAPEDPLSPVRISP